jgi:hypothetical protein
MRPKDPVSSVPDTDDVADVLWIERTEGRAFTADQVAKLALIKPCRLVEAWTRDLRGRNKWSTIDQDAPVALAPDEREFPMWRLPARHDDCAAGQTRSLWFGIVPTSSGEMDDLGRPMLDDRSMYRIVCFIRRRRPEPCPPLVTFSSPTAAYRLASFYDPQGTKNRRVSITMPDFRALSARAGQPPGPGGVEIVRPPGSQLMFDPDNGNAKPKTDGAGNFDFGSDTSRCTFALELLMIVAMFLFSLFLPIVVLLFQLWWLLLLRFCFPRPALTLQVLGAYFNGGGTLANLQQTAPAPTNPNDPPLPDLDMLDELLDATGAGAQLQNPANRFPTESAVAGDLVAALDPDASQTTLDRTPESVPGDPLCT